MDEAADTACVDSPPHSNHMDVQVDIMAGEALKALWGHTIMVDGQYMRIGDDGSLSVKPATAQRLLKQSGWALVEQPPSRDEPDQVAEVAPEQEPNESPYRGGKNRKKKR